MSLKRYATRPGARDKGNEPSLLTGLGVFIDSSEGDASKYAYGTTISAASFALVG